MAVGVIPKLTVNLPPEAIVTGPVAVNVSEFPVIVVEIFVVPVTPVKLPTAGTPYVNPELGRSSKRIGWPAENAAVVPCRLTTFIVRFHGLHDDVPPEYFRNIMPSPAIGLTT